MDEDGSLQARIDLSFDSPVYAEWYDTGIIPHRCSTPFMIFNPYMFLRLVDRRYQWRQNPRDRLSVNQKLRLARAGIFDQQILSEREWLQHYATDTYPAERRWGTCGGEQACNHPKTEAGIDPSVVTRKRFLASESSFAR